MCSGPDLSTPEARSSWLAKPVRCTVRLWEIIGNLWLAKNPKTNARD